MKNWLKIWVVALAMLATVATLASTGSVKADDESNRVIVNIGEYNDGQNTCTWSNYEYTFTGSTEMQTGSKSGTITCKFWNMSWQAVTLRLYGDLVLSGNGGVTIPSSHVFLTNSSTDWNVSPDVVRGSTEGTTFELQNFTETKTLFNKSNNTIGDADSDNVVITVEVPAGQPNGTYNGTLVLSYGG